MRAKAKSGYNYSLLKRKMIIRVVLAAAVAVAVVLILREMSRGSLADALIRLIMRVRSMDELSAEIFYNVYVRNNINFLMLVAIFSLFIVIFRILLVSFTKYFDGVIVGIDSITHDGGERIELAPELEFVEQKLNAVKETLERRSQEAALAEQQKNDLVLYLAHDIKTPLTSVVGYLNLLDEVRDLPDDQKAKYVRIALEKANRLETLVNEFFEITRYNLQPVSLEKERIDLGFLMAQISDELYPQLKASGKELQIDIEGGISLYGDAEKLARVFNNILKNAIAYSDGGSLIRVAARQAVERTVILFESRGAIPADRLEAVFKKFNRLNSARSSATGGAGLGLAIARDIVSAHGGDIRAESDGTHTVFIVELPPGGASPDFPPS